MATDAVPMTATRPIPGPRAAADPTPDIRPRAGYELLVGVEKVLARLVEANTAGEVAGEVAAPIGLIGLADDLRTALARTAALGDSCRVRPQCDGVRLAADLLLAGEVVDAHAILIRMGSELADRQRR
jgi:hypothetical protein